ncbi:MAG: hypothetical protein HUJ22_03910 [Gracilimonas sp.]|uniref:hypothetical protein n=1 Tax=Gracilimonas sp. TaxID=1974203 RepID=UPI001988D7B3|nr:hypothetical protein [Gracilimonas sp.]MBD3615695.1 hypothetical protein [Gracilimonas sp.]
MKLTLYLNLVIILSVLGCSTDAQKAPIEIESAAAENSSFPRLFTDNTGTIFMSWLEESGNIAKLKYSAFDGESWSAPDVIASDSSWFINWADYPSVIAQNGKPMAAHWLNKVEGGSYAYHINMASYDGEWGAAFTPHKDDTPTEHGFVSMTPASDSTYLAVWLDGRNTAHRENDEYSDLNKAMTLRAAFINQQSDIIDGFMLDDSACDCCNTAITKTDKGFVAAYRNRTDEEIRDIYITSYIDGSWSEPKPVYSDNWNIAACPVNGPAVDAFGNTVAVAWFTGAEGIPHVQMALSSDHGQTFESPISLDKNAPLGRVDLNMTEEKIWVSWLSPNETDAKLNISSYSHGGTELESYSIPNLSKSRSSGFPHISVLDEGLMIAYTDVGGNQPAVKTIILK